MDLAENEVHKKLDDVNATIRVESTMAIAHALICPLLPIFVSRHPSISIATTLINSPRNLIEFGTDVAIRVDHVDNAELLARPICQAKHVVCISPALVMRQPLPVSPRDLDPKQCLGLLTEGQYVPRPWNFSRGKERFAIFPRGPLCCNSSDALINAAIQGLGLIHLPDTFVKSHIVSGTLVTVYSDWDYDTRIFYAVTPKARYVSPRVRAFVDFLSETLREEKNSERLGIIPVREAQRAKRSRAG